MSFRPTAPAACAADTHDVLRVRGARENNLKGVDVDIPKRRLTVFTGVSGSGKSSLVFDTIAAESRRLINETYSAFLQSFMPAMARPDVDSLEGLTAAIIVDQERLGTNARSTVGTATDANALLRVLFSRLGQPHIGSSQAFSFNVPSARGSGRIAVQRGSGRSETREFVVTGGMCPRCEGMGTVTDVDVKQLIDADKSLLEGAITVPGYTAGGWMVRQYADSGFFDPAKPIRDYTDRERQDLLYREPTKVKIAGVNVTYEGLVPKVTKSLLRKDVDTLQPHVRAFVERAVSFSTCPDCGGTRLNEAARSSRIGEFNIADVSSMQITELAEWLRTVDDPRVAPLVSALQRTVEAFVGIGLGYLTLDRATGTLSGGEAQRTKMIRHLGSSLTDVTYVFDEPTVGLHPHDIRRMNDVLLKLRDKGNTVLVIEHKPEVIEIADHVVDLGPGAGPDGGRIIFAGNVSGLRAADTLTGRYLDQRVRLKDSVRTPTGSLPIRDATQHNLGHVDVDIPLGVLTVVTGVAGAGKSSLVHGNLTTHPDVVIADQSPLRGSRRSNPATYTGLLDVVRTAFASANGVKPALFSSNSSGACPECKGLGAIITDLGFNSTVETVCETCGGSGYDPDVLRYTLDGRNIVEVLSMTMDQAYGFLQAPAARTVLARMRDVGLGYITLGQALSTLSSGERQRLRLAVSMARRRAIYVLDEPTSGMHLADVDNLLGMLDRLVDAGNSVIVIEHHQAVIAHADWIIDMGPGAGHEGGRVVFEGTPAELVADRSTLTGKYLARYVGL